MYARQQHKQKTSQARVRVAPRSRPLRRLTPLYEDATALSQEDEQLAKPAAQYAAVWSYAAIQEKVAASHLAAERATQLARRTADEALQKAEVRARTDP